MKTHTKEAFYTAPQSENWTGRITLPGTGNDYWYQKVDLVDLNTFQNNSVSQDKIDFALLGYASDEGVRRNSGRVGAREGPKAIRQRLAKLPYHHMEKRVVDCGDILCPDKELETTHAELTKVVGNLLSDGIFPILLGGGHDIGYSHFRGIWNAVKNTSKSKIGIINFDAHFDLRPLESEANSGTPFYQILKEYGENVEYFVLGVQQQSNTKELFDIAKEYRVNYVSNYESTFKNFDEVKKQLIPFVERNDYLYITIDMDGFSSAYAPGVSAPSPMGFTPYFVLKTLEYLLISQKVISCDIAELNPNFDKDNATANLAARLVDFIVSVL